MHLFTSVLFIIEKLYTVHCANLWWYSVQNEHSFYSVGNYSLLREWLANMASGFSENGLASDRKWLFSEGHVTVLGS